MLAQRLLAALLAAEGFTGNLDALEHHQGFLEVFNGAGNYDIERILAKWGTPWDIEMPGIAIKQYPCCLSTQSVGRRDDPAVRRTRPEFEGVARIDARFFRAPARAHQPGPRRAAPSMPSSARIRLARALVDREVTLPHFEGDSYRDREIQETMKLVHLDPLDARTLAREGDFFADIAVALTVRQHGRRQHRSAGRPPCWRAAGSKPT